MLIKNLLLLYIQNNKILEACNNSKILIYCKILTKLEIVKSIVFHLKFRFIIKNSNILIESFFVLKIELFIKKKLFEKFGCSKLDLMKYISL